MKKAGIKNQFYLGVATILLVCCLGVSWFQYKNMQNQALSEVHKKTEIYLTTASSIRNYVKDSLRPRIGELLSTNQFILEAMSTSFISREIMNRLKESFPEFKYKRAAVNPRNAINQADEFEVGIINWFSEHPDQFQWKGMIKKNGLSYYARMEPILVEEECLACHGDPKDAPMDLIEEYGDKHSYGYNVGDVVAADTIYIPMDASNKQIKEKTIWLFLFGFGSLFSLLAIFVLLFNRTVIKQLKRLLLNLKSIYTDTNTEASLIELSNSDEIEQIRKAFETVTNELKTVHEDLKSSEAKYRTLFQTSPNAIFLCGNRGNITELNMAGAALFEVDDHPPSPANGNFKSFFKNPENAAEFCEKVEKEGAVLNLETAMKTASGKEIDVIISAKCVEDEAGNFAGIEGVIRDITEEKLLNRHLARTERLASVGQLAAGVAHEINNPLGIIMCYGDLITKNKSSNEQVKDDIGVILKHARGCKTIVESLLNFARASETTMIKADINQCVDEIFSVLQNQAKKNNITFQQSLDEGLQQFYFDEYKIKQVLMNLLLNGIQAMPEGGSLKVTSRLEKEDNKITIEVKDTGTGIAEDNLDRIFEPFFTTKGTSEGTGLGLSVSYGIVKQHNGEIKVSSQKNVGTTFSISLPFVNHLN